LEEPGLLLERSNNQIDHNMTKDQIARWNSATSTQQVLVKFEKIYDGTTAATALPALVTVTEELAELLDGIDDQSRKQQARSGSSLEKAAALQALGDAAYEIVSAVRPARRPRATPSCSARRASAAAS